MAKAYQTVTSVAHLKKLAAGGATFVIVLNGGLGSFKHIRWDEKQKRFSVFNRIDETKQSLTETQLMDRACTNIGYAIQRGALCRA